MTDNMRLAGYFVGLLVATLLITVGVIYFFGVFAAPAPVEADTAAGTPVGDGGLAVVAPSLVPTPIIYDTPISASPTMPSNTPISQSPISSPPAPSRQSLYPLPIDDAQVESILSKLTLEQKIGQMLMVGLPEATMEEVAYLRVGQQGVGGVIFLEHNTVSAEQVAAFTQALQAEAMGQGAGLPLLIGWNHEGGPVARPEAGVTLFPSAMALGAANRPKLVYDIGQAVGAEMRSLGVNVNFAPVLDVNSNMANPVIGLRSFGTDPALVADMGQQYIAGQQSAGTIAVAKHFPGHGGVDVDSHVDLPLLDTSVELLYTRDLPPFWSAVDAGVGGVMVAHLQIPALEPNGGPASLSPRVVNGLLREQMGYDGVVMTDDMGMGAIVNHYSVEEAAIQAVLAGNDLLLTVNVEGDVDRMRAALLNAVTGGRIPLERIDEAVRRIIRLKLAYNVGAPPLAPPVTVPAEQEAHEQLAAAAGSAAVTVLRDEGGWLPLQLPNRTILLITPATLDADASRGNGLSRLGELLAARGLTVTERFYLPDAAVSVAQAQSEAAALALTVDAVVVLTSNAILREAHEGDGAQTNLVRELHGTGRPVVVVFSQLPYDAQLMPELPAQIATYGDTVWQVEGLVGVLMGDG